MLSLNICYTHFMTADQNNEPNLYKEYLEKKHSQFNTPVEVVDRVVKKATRLTPISRRRLVLGEMNEVYDLQLEGSRSVIVRISREEHPRFLAEKWAIEQSIKVGVPAPEVLLVDDLSDNIDAKSICIEEKLPGVPLDNLLESPLASKAWKKEITRKAGVILAKIHSVQTDGFGLINENGKGSYLTWKNYIFEQVKNKTGIIEAAKRINLDPQYIEQAANLLSAHQEIYQEVDSHLLHGDYGPKHLLISGDEITGVIDFEGAKAGDPARDFAWWDYFRGETLPIEWLIDGYTKVTDLGPDFELRMQLCKLNLGLIFVYYYEAEQNPSGIKHARESLVKILEYF